MPIRSGMPAADTHLPSRRARERLLFTRAHQWLRWLIWSPPAPPASPVRVLRWVFRRDYDSLTCELTLGAADYCQFSTMPPYPTSGHGIERFAEVSDALQRQCEVEALLINDGWTLELHESILA